MTTKLILASLVLGSSTLAAAAPAAQVTVSAKVGATTTVIRDHREPVISHPIIIKQPVISHPIIIRGPARPTRPIVTQPIIWHGPVYPTVTLASDMQLQNGRTMIAVGSQMGRFGTLKLEANGGRTYVQKVVVKFADGERQVMNNLDRTLVGDDCLTLDLNGNHRAITSIAVFGQEMTNGFRYERGAIRLTAS
jgi:hypothetical protein